MHSPTCLSPSLQTDDYLGLLLLSTILVHGMAAPGLRWGSASPSATTWDCSTIPAGSELSSIALVSNRKPIARHLEGKLHHCGHAHTSALALGSGVLRSRHLRTTWKRHSQVPRASSAVTEVTGGGGGGNGGGNTGGSGGGSGGGGEGNDGPSKDDSSSPDSSLLSSLAAGYLALLETNPIPTKSVTCLLLNLFADLFCQIAIEHTNSIDWKRAGVLGAIGCFMVAPCLHFWYLGLSKVIKSAGTRGALIQLFLDQFVFSPISIATFFIVLLTMEGRPHEISTKLQQDWFPTTVANWKLWVPFQFINFRLVPQSLQVAMANVVGVLWTVYLSYASHKPVAKS